MTAMTGGGGGYGNDDIMCLQNKINEQWSNLKLEIKNKDVTIKSKNSLLIFFKEASFYTYNKF